MIANDFVFSFPRYLSSKKTVDDRSLNRCVIDTFRSELNHGNGFPRILEVGSGVGSMIDRLVDWDVIRTGHYVALDSMDENVTEARKRILEWASARGFQGEPHRDGSVSIRSKGGIDLRIEFVLDDVFRFIEYRGEASDQFDVLLSNAFLDLIDMRTQLSSIIGLLKPGGLYYFTINFDGATVFEPEIEPELDDRIERLYHRTMDERITNGLKSGDSRAGRHLFNHLGENGCSVLEAGSSDWVVAPSNGQYRYDEAYFLRFIVETVGEALKNDPYVTTTELQRWVQTRRQQIDRGELFYMAHQLDYVGRKLRSPS